MVYIIGIGLAFFLSTILFTKKHKTFADKTLGTWLVIIGLHLLLVYFHNILKPIKYPQFLGVEIPFPFLHFPFLYIYTATVTNQIKLKSFHWLWHFLPALLIFFSLIDFFQLPITEKIFIFSHEGQGNQTFMKVILIALILSGFAYAFAIYRLLNNHKKNILNQFSSQEKINLKWLEYLLWGLMLIWLSVVFVDSESFTFFNVVIFVIFIGYFGIKQVGIFTNMPLDLNENIAPNNEENRLKYEKSNLSETTAKSIHNLLQQTMQNEKLFKNLDLSLSDLATKLEVHPNHLSQVINTYEQKIFFDYINFLRIEEFKQLILLPENQKYTLLALAHECGFNSKTTFNRNFKKETNLTPSEYLKQANIKLE